MIYVDTSVVVRAFDVTHPGQAEAIRVLLQPGTEKAVSELFVLEFSAAVSRRSDLLSTVSGSLNVTDNTAAMGYTMFALSKFDFTVLSTPGGLVNAPLGQLRPELAKAVELAGSLKLRSLDLLHLSYPIALRGVGYPIEGFLTTDREFIKAEDTLKQAGIGLRYIGD